MKRIFLPMMLLFALALSACEAPERVESDPKPEASPVAEKAAASVECTDVHWTHKAGEEGPAEWKSLCEGFSACSGKVQSPIDIETAKATENGELSALKVNFGSSKANIVNNGHTVQFNVDGDSTTTIGDKKYKLLQFHFHAKSEHTIDGKQYPLEVHFVHKYSDTDFAVIGVMFEEGAENALLTEYLAKFPKEEGKFEGDSMIELAKLLPEKTGYHNYDGSLTTPPCSEVVNWYVMKTPVQASKKQLEEFAAILKDNFRPVMPLDGRKVGSFGE